MVLELLGRMRVDRKEQEGPLVEKSRLHTGGAEVGSEIKKKFNSGFYAFLLRKTICGQKPEPVKA